MKYPVRNQAVLRELRGLRAGVNRREFVDWCGRWHIRIYRWDDAEVNAELAYARAREAIVIMCPNTSPLLVLAWVDRSQAGRH